MFHVLFDVLLKTCRAVSLGFVLKRLIVVIYTLRRTIYISIKAKQITRQIDYTLYTHKRIDMQSLCVLYLFCAVSLLSIAFSPLMIRFNLRIRSCGVTQQILINALLKICCRKKKKITTNLVARISKRFWHWPAICLGNRCQEFVGLLSRECLYWCFYKFINNSIRCV